MSRMLQDILLQSFLLFVGIGCVFSLLSGIVMVLRPSIILRLSEIGNQWYAIGKLTHPLDRIFRIERFVYRNHRLVGSLVLMVSVYVLYVFLFNFDQGAAVKSWSKSMSPILVSWLLEAMVVTLVLSSVFSALVGVLLLVRPSLMKGFEAAANRWRATDETLMRLDVMRDFPDRFIARHIRGVGVLIVLGSLYALSVFGFLLL